MKKMTASNILGLRGWTHVASIALEAGCKPIQVPNELDTAIDGLIELVTGEDPSGSFLAVQVKMGSSYFRDERPRVQSNKDEFIYWSKFSMPVILVVVSEDLTKAYWMDVTEHLSQNPTLTEKGPYTLWLPVGNCFTAATLSTYALTQRVEPPDFLNIVNGIAINEPAERLAAFSQLYALRHEAATPYVLVAQLLREKSQHNFQVICDFLSRYLWHPESSFFLGGTPAAHVAKQLLAGMSDESLIRILENVEDDDFSYDGATGIWTVSEEEVWPRSELFDRGTVQQSIAVVVGACASADKLMEIIADETRSLSARKSALAMFGYLGHSCSVEFLDSAAKSATDEVLRALLDWLRFTILEESGAAYDENVHDADSE